MYILSINTRVALSKEIIDSTCRILYNVNKKINKTNILNELRCILKEKGVLGVEYICDQDEENKPYEGLGKDTKRICNELNI